MDSNTANSKMVTRLLFRLLPVQILLAAAVTVNGLVSTFFAANYLGVDATSAVGLYGPVQMLFMAGSLMLTGGATFLCGKNLGQNNLDRFQSLFASGLATAFIMAFSFVLLMMLSILTGITTLTINDDKVADLFNTYLLAQAIGVIPLMIGNQLSPFLLVENKERRAFLAGVIYIATNLVLNYLFVVRIGMGIFGIGLASSIGLWLYCGVQAEYFISSQSYINYYRKNISRHDAVDIIKSGNNDAASTAAQVVRGFILNYLLLRYIGSVGLSAFTAADNFLKLFWAIPTAMLVVSRMMISLSIGEEDRRTLVDVMRNMFKRFMPLMAAISLLIIILARQIAFIFYRDANSEVFEMAVLGLRILPLCMPLGILSMHFVFYAASSKKPWYTMTLYLLDGVVCVAVLASILIHVKGIGGVYTAHVLSSVIVTFVIIGYAWVRNKHFPTSIEDLMVIDANFGVEESERMDISVQSIEEVVTIAERIQDFCLEKGIDDRRAHLAGLYMEEMAGNIVDHGFTKDNKKHAIDARVVHLGDEIILRIKDDCVPFNPRIRKNTSGEGEITKNIGIRMVYNMAKDIKYQNILGMNVLTIRI